MSSALASRRSPSLSPPPPAKRQRLENGPLAPLVSIERNIGSFVSDDVQTGKPMAVTEASTSECTSHLNYRDAVVLAPMVRSGTLPSRLLALKYGADLVWGPEIVDRAMIGCERVVDEKTGVVSFEKEGKPVWTTHPVEKPYLIYQIGSASPELAVKAALMVMKDVSGVELNCGCPKPFSTHGGMGANLLTTPDLLCDILSALRKALPSHIAVSAKIRLLPDQNDTIKLVERIAHSGVSCLTVHCRTKEMRPRERALVNRLRELVEAVESTGLGLPVIENGDCASRDDAIRLKELTGAHSVMIATAAEKNPSCFRPGPLADAEAELAPTYLSLARHLKNPWGNTKHCLSQFSSPSTSSSSKGALKEFKQRLSQAKDYEALADITRDGAAIFEDIERVVQARPPSMPQLETHDFEATTTTPSSSASPALTSATTLEYDNQIIMKTAHPSMASH